VLDGFDKNSDLLYMADLLRSPQCRVEKKVAPVLGGFDKNNYKSEREWAVAKDGTRIPISIVYREDKVKLNGSDPMLLDAYGSYGICNDPR
jgi:oligopeptidase B